MFGREQFCRRAAWVWLVDHAAFREKAVPIGGKEIALKRGQLCYSLRFLAEAWGWELTRVRRFLKKLEGCHAIATATATGGATAQSVITICNYDKYQAAPCSTATATATPPDSQPPQIRKKGKKEEEYISAIFEQFWQHVPRKVGKGQARKAFNAALKKTDIETLLAGIKAYADSRHGEDPQFTKHPTTWLNGECWADDHAGGHGFEPPSPEDREFDRALERAKEGGKLTEFLAEHGHG